MPSHIPRSSRLVYLSYDKRFSETTFVGVKTYKHYWGVEKEERWTVSEKKTQRGVFLWVCSADCVLEMSASLEATGGWMINGVCVFLVYLRVHVYMCMCVRVYAFECLCVQNVFVTTLARSQLKCLVGLLFPGAGWEKCPQCPDRKMCLCIYRYVY